MGRSAHWPVVRKALFWIQKPATCSPTRTSLKVTSAARSISGPRSYRHPILRGYRFLRGAIVETCLRNLLNHGRLKLLPWRISVRISRMPATRSFLGSHGLHFKERKVAQAAAQKSWQKRDLPNWRIRVDDLLKGKQIIVSGRREWNAIYVAARRKRVQTLRKDFRLSVRSRSCRETRRQN